MATSPGGDAPAERSPDGGPGRGRQQTSSTASGQHPRTPGPTRQPPDRGGEEAGGEVRAVAQSAGVRHQRAAELLREGDYQAQKTEEVSEL